MITADDDLDKLITDVARAPYIAFALVVPAWRALPVRPLPGAGTLPNAPARDASTKDDGVHGLAVCIPGNAVYLVNAEAGSKARSAIRGILRADVLKVTVHPRFGPRALPNHGGVRSSLGRPPPHRKQGP